MPTLVHLILNNIHKFFFRFVYLWFCLRLYFYDATCSDASVNAFLSFEIWPYKRNSRFTILFKKKRFLIQEYFKYYLITKSLISIWDILIMRLGNDVHSYKKMCFLSTIRSKQTYITNVYVNFYIKRFKKLFLFTE